MRGTGEDARIGRALTLIHNPGSGDESLPLESLYGLLEEAGYRTFHVASDGPWKEALAEPCDLVAVVGGDGTVGTVLTEMVGRPAPVAILPVGTANNIARTLGIRGHAADVIRGWQGAQLRPLDVWEVRGGSDAGRFVEAFGGGFVGTLIERGIAAEPPSLILGGALDRARHLLGDVVSREPEREWLIEVDGVDHSGRFIGVEAMSIRAVGPNAPLAPLADPGDGRIDVVLIGAEQRHDLIRGLASMSSDRTAAWPPFPTFSGDVVRLVPPWEARLHIDDAEWSRGDADRTSELTVSLGGQVRYVATD